MPTSAALEARTSASAGFKRSVFLIQWMMSAIYPAFPFSFFFISFFSIHSCYSKTILSYTGICIFCFPTAYAPPFCRMHMSGLIPYLFSFSRIILPTKVLCELARYAGATAPASCQWIPLKPLYIRQPAKFLTYLFYSRPKIQYIFYIYDWFSQLHFCQYPALPEKSSWLSGMLFLFLAGFFKSLSVHGKTASYLWQTFKLAFWNVFFIPSLKFLSISCLSIGFFSYFHTGYLPIPRYTHWFFQWFILFLADLLAGFSASHWIILLETDWHFFTDTSHSL